MSIYITVGKYHFTLFPPKLMRVWGFAETCFYPLPCVYEFGLGPFLTVSWL